LKINGLDENGEGNQISIAYREGSQWERCGLKKSELVKTSQVLK
jgi:hypothetical protein